MKIEITKNLTETQKEIVVRLWNSEYPIQINFPEIADFDNFVNSVTNCSHFLLFAENEILGGWLMTFTRDDERWFSVIVDGNQQKKGFGTGLLNEIKKHESEINGWVVPHDNYLKKNGQPYISPIEFYGKNGFDILPDVTWEKPGIVLVKIKWTKKTPAD